MGLGADSTDENGAAALAQANQASPAQEPQIETDDVRDDDLDLAAPSGPGETLAEEALQAIAQAAIVGDHAAVLRIAAPFEKRAAAADLLDANILKIHAATVQATLKLGRADDAAQKLRWIYEIYGPQSSLALVAAKTSRLRKDPEGALRAVNEGIAAQAPRGRTRGLQSLFEVKAELLLERGERLEARALIKECLKLWRSFTLLRLLRQTIVSKDEVGEYENAVFPYLSTFGGEIRNALYHYSYLLRDLNDYDRAIAVARQRFLAVIARYALGSVVKKTGESWVKDAEVALADLQDDFAAAGLDFFLISGTLLGQVRENGILGHDKDIDVGVGEETTLDAVYKALEKSSRFFVRPIPQTDNSVYIEHANGVRIDVFRHFMRDNRYYHEGLKVSWWNTPFKLQSASFLGRQYRVPENADLYLQENYGNWRVPNSEFETFVDTPNMEIHNSEYLVWYFMLSLADYFIWGKTRQFRKVWEALSKLHRVDAYLAANVEDVLANEEKYRQLPAATLARRIRSGVLPVAEGDGLPGLEAAVDANAINVPSSLSDLARWLRRSTVTDSQAFIEAASLYKLLLARPDNRWLLWRFERAAEIAGRAKMAIGQYVEACQVWYSVRQVTRNKSRANRNLIAAALKGARATEAMGDKRTAFLLWRFLLDAQPDSQAAMQGLVRCA